MASIAGKTTTTTTTKPTFNDELVLKLISYFDENTSKKNKLNNQTVKLFGEGLRLFVVEAIHRAAEEARVTGVDKIEISHVQSIMGQMLLDF